MAHKPGSTVLVVDDDSGVRMLIARALTRKGYRVLEASSAEEAHDRIRELAGPPDLIMTDVVLPGTSGPELIRQIGESRARVLFMSGYSARDLRDRIGAGALLEKPFTVDVLLKTVARTLSA